MVRNARAELRFLARDPLLFVLLVAVALAIVVFVVYPLVRVLFSQRPARRHLLDRRLS